MIESSFTSETEKRKLILENAKKDFNIFIDNKLRYIKEETFFISQHALLNILYLLKVNPPISEAELDGIALTLPYIQKTEKGYKISNLRFLKEGREFISLKNKILNLFLENPQTVYSRNDVAHKFNIRLKNTSSFLVSLVKEGKIVEVEKKYDYTLKQGRYLPHKSYKLVSKEEMQ